MHEATADSEFAEDDDGDSTRPEYVRALERRFRQLTATQQSVLWSRFCDRDHATLDKLGADIGVTRERVRQIEASGLDKLAGKPLKNIDDDFGVLGERLEFIDAVDARHAEAVTEAVAELGQLELPVTESRLVEAGFEPFDCPTTRLILAVAKRMGAFGRMRARPVRHGGRDWLIAGDRTPTKLMHDLTEAARDTGVVSDLVEFWGDIEQRLRPHVGSDDEAAGLAADMVESLGLTEIGGRYAVLGGVGVVDGLVRILRANETPMKRDVLTRYFPDRSPSTVTTALLDPLFVRVRRDEFALKESGATARPTLRDLMYSEIDRYGQVSVHHLQDLAEQHDYSRNSIAFYSALPDVIEDGGVLRRRRDDDPPAIPEPGLDGHCFQIAAGPYRGCWSCTVRVNHYRLYRGPQWIPTPLAELLDIAPGSREVPITWGSNMIHATWLQSPYLFGGQLRQALDDQGYADGELVRLIILGPRELRVEPVPVNSTPQSPYRTLVTGAGLYDGAGQPVSDAELAAALAFAVGLPPDAPLHVLERRLTNRHNRELRDALVQIYVEDFAQ
ncbi:RNA polymerase sigma factor RpoS [Mycobacterium simulans]|uniref:sigma factor-like helix-turn-helix DNA-binding protein n=1 Tax=Mycobacterium simulans TaxID=627089 RepID=UPI00174880AF|nr:sigma factor-like helix-turn-helix DNA-binding protein [Mycobacterium simulans]SON60155.1 RNA polymerase sigma factor RpoS [Mycobacterium simulans]